MILEIRQGRVTCKVTDFSALITIKISSRFIIPFFSGSGGCNDAFTGFGFLAFLLALLDLILELQDGNRRRRSVQEGLIMDPDILMTLALEVWRRVPC